MKQTLNSKKNHLIQLSIVMIIFILPVLVNSIALYTHLSSYTSKDNFSCTSNFLFHILFLVAGISLVLYILHKQNKSVRDIGLYFSFKDVFKSIKLFIFSYIILLIVGYVLLFTFKGSLNNQIQNIEPLTSKISVFYILLMIINPIFEELIVRAYLMTEIEFLTGKKSIAILLSVLVQASYHIYQGLSYVIIWGILFFIYSLYYSKKKRLMPIILAHMYLDIIAMLQLASF